MPEFACGSRAMSMEQGGAIELDGGSGGIKVSGAAMVTELANRDEITRGKMGKDIG